jgi:SAM-dependent methyltransferase
MIRKLIARSLGRAVMGAFWRAGNSYYLTGSSGRVLEIGCGGGDGLQKLKSLGWEVEGQDVDPNAVLRARAVTGSKVHLGDLRSLQLPAGTYDAIVGMHVFEHVYQPSELLRECRRLLKPNGTLVIVTPNANSLLHRHFRTYWRDLDPPRHVHVFTCSALKSLAARTNFGAVSVFTTPLNAFFVAYSSVTYRLTSLGVPDILQLLLTIPYSSICALLERLAHLRNADIGEECVLVARMTTTSTA